MDGISKCAKLFQLGFFKKIRSLFLLFIITSLTVCYGNSSLKVMTFNVNLLPDIPISPLSQNLNHPFERARLIPYQIAKHDPDVVVFQEDIDLIMYSILNTNMERAGFIYKTKVVGSWDFDHLNLLTGGVIIYSKYPFAESPEYLVYPKSYGWEAIANKGAVFAAIRKKGKVYDIISTHLQSIQYGSEDELAQITHWKVQVGALNQWIANLNLPADRPLILAGDVNANTGIAKAGEVAPISQDYPLYLYLVTALNASQAAPYSQNTLPYSFDGITNSMNDSTVRETLDHILCFDGYKCALPENSSIEVVALRSSMLEAPDLSDHYAVIGHLVFD